VRGLKQLPLVGLLVLTLGVPIAIAADPSPSVEPSTDTQPSATIEALGSAEPSGDANASASAEPSDAVAPSTPTQPSETAGPSENQQPSETAPSQPAPLASSTPDHDKLDSGSATDNADKHDGAEGPEIAVTIDGVVGESTNGKGWKTYTLQVGAKTYELSAGPPWFWGDKNPLAAYVGKSVQVKGSMEQNGTEVDVESVNGKLVRAPGRPPWAGGPWVVGENHPGWKPWMAGGKHGHGHDNAPGQLKDKSGQDEPDADESPLPS
jgi:hypothetical protein